MLVLESCPGIARHRPKLRHLGCCCLRLHQVFDACLPNIGYLWRCVSIKASRQNPTTGMCWRPGRVQWSVPSSLAKLSVHGRMKPSVTSHTDYVSRLKKNQNDISYIIVESRVCCCTSIYMTLTSSKNCGTHLYKNKDEKIKSEEDKSLGHMADK